MLYASTLLRLISICSAVPFCHPENDNPKNSHFDHIYISGCLIVFLHGRHDSNISVELNLNYTEISATSKQLSLFLFFLLLLEPCVGLML